MTTNELYDRLDEIGDEILDDNELDPKLVSVAWASIKIILHCIERINARDWNPIYRITDMYHQIFSDERAKMDLIEIEKEIFEQLLKENGLNDEPLEKLTN